MLSDTARAGLLKGALIDRLEAVIRETVKPLENIEGIKVLHVGGDGAGGASATTPMDEVINSALRYRVQAPMTDALMGDVGVKGAHVSRAGDLFRTARLVGAGGPLSPRRQVWKTT